jgi:glycosyltransferase involved in cell wall biosynthesis
MSAPRVTVIVPTRDRDTMIIDCLRSLLAADYPRLDIVVVDQSSTDATGRVVSAAAGGNGRVRLCSTRSSGVSAARNLGASVCDSEIVAYTDDDCTVDPGWLRALVCEFEDPDVAAVYGRVLPAGTWARTGTEVAFKPTEGRSKFTERIPPWYIGHGANMAFRRAALLEAGGFDPLLGAGGVFPAGGDLDIVYRLIASGKAAVYTGAALVYHKQWRDWQQRARVERNYGVGVGALFTKYIRSGDLYGLQLLARWIWELGVRRLAAGLLKWRSVRPMYLGYCQLVYPWIGVARALRWPIDPEHRVYRER